ncbi:MAG: hypothetical protein KGZ58_12565 [Ignavibacteriales bacterium]|nr:hypothetical protein [Ignavibacteriales bacterium]
MKLHNLIFIFHFSLLTLFIGCDTLFTSKPETGETFDQTLEGLTRTQKLAFARGDEAFEKTFSVIEGLGPIFVQPSCEGCHNGDGKGHPRTNLKRFQKNDGSQVDTNFTIQYGGAQLQQRSIPGIPPEEIPSQRSAISTRSGPPVFGMGLIEAIDDATILANVDSGDGISGKANFVPAHEMAIPPNVNSYNGKYLGRFGRKSGTPFLLQQVATAYLQDMGITSEFFPQELQHAQLGTMSENIPEPEVSFSTLNDVANYLRMLAPPKRGKITSQIKLGDSLFTAIGCANCHIPKMQTGIHPTIAALSNKQVHLYSDLLLHDMGDELADNFIEGEANGKEWRTTPLWGLRLYAENLGGTAYYLHDGRTNDLKTAILFHGGEAMSARNLFNALSNADKEAVLAFLRSL